MTAWLHVREAVSKPAPCLVFDPSGIYIWFISLAPLLVDLFSTFSKISGRQIMASHTDISIPPQSYWEARQENPNLTSQYDIIPCVDQSNFSHDIKEDVSLIRNSCESNTQDDSVRKKSWRAPFIMLFDLFSATILAFLHDRMNRSLDGNIVNPNGRWNNNGHHAMEQLWHSS